MLVLQQIKNELKKFNQLDLDPTEPTDAAVIATLDNISELIENHDHLTLVQETELQKWQ